MSVAVNRELVRLLLYLCFASELMGLVCGVLLRLLDLIHGNSAISLDVDAYLLVHAWLIFFFVFLGAFLLCVVLQSELIVEVSIALL